MTKKNDPDSPDRKTRVEGDRVIHTPAGMPFNHDERGDGAPRGLTREQWDEERYGAERDDLDRRYAAAGEHQAGETGDINERHPKPGARDGSDELTDLPSGKKDSRPGYSGGSQHGERSSK